MSISHQIESEPRPIRVLIVDRHHRVRVALATALNIADDLLVVGEAATGLDALVLSKTLMPDVVLMEIDLPDANGIGVIGSIRRSAPNTGVVILATMSTPDLRRRAREAGAIGYLQKYTDSRQVISMIRSAFTSSNSPSDGGPADLQGDAAQ